jgi:hypothetical protein
VALVVRMASTRPQAYFLEPPVRLQEAAVVAVSSSKFSKLVA